MPVFVSKKANLGLFRCFSIRKLSDKISIISSAIRNSKWLHFVHFYAFLHLKNSENWSTCRRVMTYRYPPKTTTPALFIGLWGLIIAKCYILEFWVRVYAVPINSAFYVWFLTLSMAAIASAAFCRLPPLGKQDHVQPSSLTPSRRNVVCTGIGAAILAITLTWTTPLTITVNLQSIFAFILSLGHFAIGVSEHKRWPLAGGFAWGIGALFLFLATPTTTLLLFGGLMLLLVALPAGMLWVRSNRTTLQNPAIG